VVYGHPFETVDAERRRRRVEAYWSGAMDEEERTAFLQQNRVDYVLVGPRERALTTADGAGFQVEDPVFETGDTKIYPVNESR
jgi:uncharacterized membrane protein